jgi:hypothetical protein
LKVVELGEKHTALEIQYSVLLAEVLRRKLSTVRVTLNSPGKNEKNKKLPKLSGRL